MPNQNPNASDLFQTWKAMYDQFETTWAKPVQEMLESDSFTQGLAQNRTQYVNSSKVNREAVEKQLEALRIPTKTDLARLATQILSVENHSEAVEDAVEELGVRLARIEGKLDQLLAHLAPPATQAPVTKPVSAIAMSAPTATKAPEVPAKATVKAAAAPAAATVPAAKAAATPAKPKAKPVEAKPAPKTRK